MNIASSAGPSPSLPQMLEAAAAAWKQRDYRGSIGILERASQLVPNEAGIFFQMGYCHGWCYDYAAADDCFEKAIRVAVRKKEAFLAAGLHCLKFRQNEMAGRYFERALKQDGNSIEALVQLAQVRERQNHVEEAVDLMKQALKLDPGCPPALLALARLYRMSGRLEEAETLLRSFVGSAHPDVSVRALAWYELGATLDSQRRYDDAMAAILEAKKLLRPLTVQNAAHLERLGKVRTEMAKTVSADLFRRWRESTPVFQPQHRFAMLCGHPRSGTTLLEQVLDSHPNILSVEETTIFNDEALVPLADGKPTESIPLLPLLNSVPSARLQQSRADYFRCADGFLGQPVGDRLLIDKNPSLTPFIPAVIRIFTEAKFLIALRDPRDVCVSCFMQPLMPTFPTSTVFPNLGAMVADYASIMGFWRALKPVMPNPFLEVRYEDLVEDLESVARRTLEFLEVPWNDRVLDFQKHTQNKLVLSPTYADVRKPVTRQAVGRWRNYQKYLEPHLPVLEPYLKAFGYE